MLVRTGAVVLAAVLWLAPAPAHQATGHSGLVSGTTVIATGGKTSITVTVRPDGSGSTEVRVSQGMRLHLTVKGAGTGKLRLNGYDIVVDAEQGKPAVFDLDATRTGRFALEKLAGDGQPGKRETVLLTFEVRSK